jgi:hypothetical protein
MIRHAQFKFVSVAACVAVLLIGGIATTAMFLTTYVRASSTQPSAPAQARATTAPAKLTPKEVLFALADAMVEGDHERMRSLVYTNDASQAGMLDAACDFAVASAALRQSISETYGEPMARQIDAHLSKAPMGQFVEGVRTSVRDANVEIDGRDAIVSRPDNPAMTFFLSQHDGAWQVDTGRMIADWPPDVREQRRAGLNQLSQMLTMLNDDIKNGKYTTAEEFAAAMQEMLGRMGQ